MQIPDGVGAPLCEFCIMWYVDVDGPPRQPAALERCANILEAALTSASQTPIPRNSIDCIASFSAKPVRASILGWKGFNRAVCSFNNELVYIELQLSSLFGLIWRGLEIRV